MIVAVLSDYFDGVTARRLGVATANLRRLDSIVDTIFYVVAISVAWVLHPESIQKYTVALVILILLEIFRYAFDFIKFKREASYHMSVLSNC